MNKSEQLKSICNADSINEAKIRLNPADIMALVRVMKSGIDYDFVYTDDYGRVVKGPDGEPGWFNSAAASRSFSSFDPAVVREFGDIISVAYTLVNNPGSFTMDQARIIAKMY